MEIAKAAAMLQAQKRNDYGAKVKGHLKLKPKPTVPLEERVEAELVQVRNSLVFLWSCYGVSGTEVVQCESNATACSVLSCSMCSIALWPCYGMSGTEVERVRYQALREARLTEYLADMHSALHVSHLK
eukprot:2041189-Rhodomonas_salina.3